MSCSPDLIVIPDAEALKAGIHWLIQTSDAHRVGLATALHKDVAGGLVACTSVGEMIRLDLEQKPDSAQSVKLLAQLDGTLRLALQVVRGLTEEQFPPVLKAFGLNVALQQHMRAMTSRFTGSVSLHTDGDEPHFDLGTRLNLFLIVQSLISLCVSDAAVSWIEVISRSLKSRLEISINHDASDEVWSRRQSGSEMAIILARCESADCQLRIGESGSGSRISLIALAPLTQEAQLNNNRATAFDK